MGGYAKNRYYGGTELNQMLISCTSAYQDEAEKGVTKIKIGTEEPN
jgi:hypothetical protein